MNGRPVGVLVMAYGTPRNTAEIEPYYTDIRRGRPPSAEQLADLTGRYAAIGGLSPLHERTEAQRDAIAAALEERAPGRFVVELGMRHAAPSIERGIDALAALNVDRIVGLVLAPHYSTMSVAMYLERAGRAAAARGVGFVGIERWGLLDAYVAFLAGRVRDAVATMPTNTKVVFTAHSLPTRILATGDPYPLEVRATASAVAVAAGLGRWSGWSAAWQSAGRTADAWLGPDILEVIDDLGPAENADGLLVCPCGFVADHLEVLFDLDVQARQRAEAAGLMFARTAVVNDDPGVTSALAALIAET
jgi:protoporphyrin/coproporphyrin ferrochelatase